jgi:acyl-CoA synthetase (AMP-forming)/AMP-acid ligase II
MVPFNINYRYGPDEIRYLLENSDAEALIVDECFLSVLTSIKESLLGVRVIVVGSSTCELVGNIELYRDVLSRARPSKVSSTSSPRTGDDTLILYTGGTTGLPKGVIWRQEDLIARSGYGSNMDLGVGPLSRVSEAKVRSASMSVTSRYLIACPLMHGSGHITAFVALTQGSTVVLMPNVSFDAEALWDVAEQEQVGRLTIVGQAFAQPMVEVLDRYQGRWQLACLRVIQSAGVMWSEENKAALLLHLPHLLLVDSLSSSEALGMGYSVVSLRDSRPTGCFVPGTDCAVFNEQGSRVRPGSGEIGRVAVSGRIPLGYHNDEELSKRTFPTIEGKRWSVPGDWAEILSDGSLRLLGRGSQCINSGGEKVFSEEVEEALKRHSAVRDAAVAGVPDTRFGECVGALVELQPGLLVSETELRDFARRHLAGYKVPKQITFVAAIQRTPTGKLDYQYTREAIKGFSEQSSA